MYFRLISPQRRQSAYKFPSAGRCWQVLARRALALAGTVQSWQALSGIKNRIIRFFNFRIRYDTIKKIPNKAKSGPLGAAGNAVQCWPVLAGPSGCWGAGALGALSGTGNRLTHHTRFPDVVLLACNAYLSLRTKNS